MAKKPAKKTVRDEWVTLPDGRVVKNHERHDFSKPTRLLLMQMAGGMCSKPGCGIHTGGSNAEQTSHAWVHNVAHICSAAPGVGAARYDPDQTEAERKSHENGIWLCANHATIIDSDEKNYSVELLKSWKRQAQRRSNEMLGQPSFSLNELNRAVHAAVGHHKSYEITHESGPLVKESLNAYQARLSELDDRFHVKVTASSESMVSEISAREGHTPIISMVFNEDAADSAQSAWQTMLDNGKSFSIPTSDFEFKGSKLFESLNGEREGGVMTISPQPKIHQATIYFISDDFEFELETVDAHMYRGAKKHSIEGKAFDGILSFTYEYLMDAAVTNFTYTFNVDYWLNQKITDLKHYNRLAKAYKFISKSKDLKICVKLHVQNSEVSLGVGPSSAYESLFERISSIMYLTECSQKIAKQFSRPLRFKTLELSAVEDRMVIRYAEAMDGEVHSTFTPNEEICTAILKDVPETLMTAMENHDVTAQLRFSDNTTFDFFGNRVTLPKIITDLLNFELNLFSSLHSRDKGALYCIVYAVEGTSSIQYVASDEPYILHKT